MDAITENGTQHAIGGTARMVDALPIAHRIRIHRRTRIKIALVFAAYVATLALVAWGSRLVSADSALVTITILPAVILLAFVFETLDSGVGMGFGTALSPLLLLMGYDPLAVVPVLLISDAATGLLSGLFHHEFRNADFRLTRPFTEDTKAAGLIITAGIGAMVASVTLTYFALNLPDTLIAAYAGLLVLLMGVAGIARQRIRTRATYRPRRLAAFAALAAFNKGIGGGGYGPVVTLGEVFSGVYEKSAAAITSVAEGVVSTVGVLTFVALALAGVAVDLHLLPSVLAGGLLAAVVAPYLVRVIPHRIYRYAIPSYAALLGGVLLARLVA